MFVLEGCSIFHGLHDFHGFMFFHVGSKGVRTDSDCSGLRRICSLECFFIRVSILHDLHDVYVLCVVGLLVVAFS